MRRGAGRHAAALAASLGLFVSAVLALAVGPPDGLAVHADGAVTSAFTAVTPMRLADTRGAFGGYVRLDAHTITIPVRDRLGPDVAATATAVAVTITMVATEGFATVYPAGSGLPVASTVNAAPRALAASASTIAAIGADGAINVYTSSSVAEIIVDVSGVFTPAASSRTGRYVALAPTRILDTRSSNNPIVSGAPMRVPNPPAVPTDAVALAVNVTAVPSTGGSGYASLSPAGAPVPNVSQLSIGERDEASAAAMIVPITAAGFDIWTSFDGHLIVDVAGYFTGPSAADGTEGLYVALPTPVRRLDTRQSGPLHAGGGVETAIPTDAMAMTGTITVTATGGWGFVSAYASGAPIPETSSVNHNRPGDTVANFLVTAISDRGVAASSAGRTHVIIDQTGYFTGERAIAQLPPLVNPVPLPTYPEGPCDTLTPGLEPLAPRPGQRPADLLQIGTSVQGRPIWAEYWGPPAPSRTVLIVGQVHGNECGVTRVTKAVRENVPADYGIWLVPTLNPDGYAHGDRHNANGVDLNADGGSVSQPETHALMAFTAEVRPHLTVHLHTPNGFVGWHGPAPAAEVGLDVAVATGMPLKTAGSRPDRHRWFLWQGQQTVHSHATLLVELPAVDRSEVPHGRPWRYEDIATVDMRVAGLLDVLDRYF